MMLLWDGQSLPVTSRERALRVKIILVGLVTLLAVVGTYSAGRAQGLRDLERIIDQRDTYAQAVVDLRDRERLSMDYIREYDRSLAAELERRNRLWGDSLDPTP